MSLYLVAAEASGDLLAREVAEFIRRKSPGTRIDGTGGNELAAIGIVSPIDIAPLSVLGFVEGIKAYGDVVRLADAVAEDILRKQPKVVVLVDSWGFMLRVAQRVPLQAAPVVRARVAVAAVACPSARSTSAPRRCCSSVSARTRKPNKCKNFDARIQKESNEKPFRH